MAESDPNSGPVYRFLLSPGRPDFVMVDYGNRPHTYDTYHGTFSAGSDAVVTCDGKAVTFGELFAWLAEARGVEIILKPDVQRYGLSLHTEFRSVKPS